MNNNSNSLKRSTFYSLGWKLLERIGLHSGQFILTIFLTRILNPSDFGLFALIMVFITIFQELLTTSFSAALIQKNNVDNLDFSTVFVGLSFISILIYIILFFSLPILEELVQIVNLTMYVRVLSIILLFNSLTIPQFAHASRFLRFKDLSLSNLYSSLISAFIGIIFAFLGFGIWAIIFQQVFYQFLSGLFVFIRVKWLPDIIFSFKRLKVLFHYSSKLILATLLNVLFSDLRTILIGFYYSNIDLGHYNRADQIPRTSTNLIEGSFRPILFATLSKFQNDILSVRNIFSRSIKLLAFIIAPLMVFIYISSREITLILFTENWIPIVPYMKLFALINLVNPFQTLNFQVINSLGHTKKYLFITILKKFIDFGILIITFSISLELIILGTLLSSIISYYLSGRPLGKLINYPFFKQVLDISPYLLLAILSSIFTSNILIGITNNFLSVIFKGLLLVTFYLFLNYLLNTDSMIFIINEFNKIFIKKVKLIE